MDFVVLRRSKHYLININWHLLQGQHDLRVRTVSPCKSDRNFSHSFPESILRNKVDKERRLDAFRDFCFFLSQTFVFRNLFNFFWGVPSRFSDAAFCVLGFRPCTRINCFLTFYLYDHFFLMIKSK